MNTNCLAGIKCPSCGSEGPVEVEATSWFTLEDDGTDDFGDVIYDERSPMRCSACGHLATTAEFQGLPKPMPPRFLVLLDENGDVANVLLAPLDDGVMPVKALVVSEQIDDPDHYEPGDLYDLNGKQVRMHLASVQDGEKFPAVFEQAFELFSKEGCE